MDPYQAFLAQRRVDLQRIARQTCGEYTAEDIEGEAWLIAERIATKRGFAINFSHRADQGPALAWPRHRWFSHRDLRYVAAATLGARVAG